MYNFGGGNFYDSINFDLHKTCIKNDLIENITDPS